MTPTNKTNDIKFYVLGCRGTRPITGRDYQVFGGATSCYLLKANNRAVVLDCGTGFYDAAPLLADCKYIDILLTHLHYDHILGFLHTGAFPKDANITICLGTDGQSDAEIYESFGGFLKTPYWPISPRIGQIKLVKYGYTFSLTPNISACFAPSNHPNHASIIRINTDEGCMGLFCDWEHSGSPIPDFMTEGCDFVLFDGMFEDAEYELCKGWGHSTWKEGIRLVQGSNIPVLLITHHAPERTDTELHIMENTAKQSYHHLRFVRSGDCYTMKGELLTS